MRTHHVASALVVALAGCAPTARTLSAGSTRWNQGSAYACSSSTSPEGMSMRTLAFTVMAPEENFEEVIEGANPIIDSIEFHTG